MPLPLRPYVPLLPLEPIEPLEPDDELLRFQPLSDWPLSLSGLLQPTRPNPDTARVAAINNAALRIDGPFLEETSRLEQANRTVRFISLDKNVRREDVTPRSNGWER